ncbi:MAG: cation-translocating P-type ATPase, partial [Kiritimatiellae bacterium]|nr:cation-translocating P-type ATPase [Kiritimatiellia bacterium]
ARLGVLVKDVADLEAASRINAFVFDKTGTLTTGRLGVARLAPREGVSPSALLNAAANAEQYSNHPAARALVALATETGLALTEPSDFHEEPGQGIRASVDGKPVVCGRAGWLRANGVADPLLDEADAGQAEGYSVGFVAEGGRYLGWVGFQDQVRAEAKPCLDELRELGIQRLAMVTGDRRSVADQVAASVDCRDYRAGCLPEEKVSFVNAVRAEGYRVAVVGDGVNDAPALAAGDIGVAMGAAGSDVAIHSATVALMSNDLRRVPFLVRLSRGARMVIFQNLGVGVLFIVGGLVLSGLGLLNPIIAAILHNAGSLIVVFNSARLVRSGEELDSPAALTASWSVW